MSPVDLGRSREDEACDSSRTDRTHSGCPSH